MIRVVLLAAALVGGCAPRCRVELVPVSFADGSEGTWPIAVCVRRF